METPINKQNCSHANPTIPRIVRDYKSIDLPSLLGAFFLGIGPVDTLLPGQLLHSGTLFFARRATLVSLPLVVFSAHTQMSKLLGQIRWEDGGIRGQPDELYR